MVAVGKDLVLVGQVRAAAVDQIDAGQAAFLGDLLGAQVLLDRHRVIGAALDRRVIGDDHHVLAMHPPDPGDDPRTGRGPVVQAMRGQRADLQERAAGVQKVRHPFPRGHLAAADMALQRLGAAARNGDLRRLARGLQQGQMRGAVGAESL